MNMKKYAMILVAISMSFVSCEKWLDLQQEGEITASQLYGKGEGYRIKWFVSGDGTSGFVWQGIVFWLG